MPTQFFRRYAPYSADYSTYPMSYYNAYGGTAMQFPVYGGANAGITAAGNTSFYPYYQFGQSAGGTGPAYTQGQSYGLQYPAQMFQYSVMSSTAGITGFAAQHYGAPISPPSAQPAGFLSIEHFQKRSFGEGFRRLSRHQRGVQATFAAKERGSGGFRGEGMMGSGKTTVGKILSEVLGYSFFDR